MACNHESIRCTNGVKYCLKCGEKLPNDFIPGKITPAQDKAVESPENSVKKRARKKV